MNSCLSVIDSNFNYLVTVLEIFVTIYYTV